MTPRYFMTAVLLMPFAAGHADDQPFPPPPAPLETLVDRAALTDGRDGLRALERLSTPLLVATLLDHHVRATAAGDGVLVGAVIERLQRPAHDMVAAAVPYLDHDDPAWVGAVTQLLAHYENRSATREPDFSAYRAVIESDVRAGRAPAPALLRFMLASDPGLALRTFVRGYQLRDPDGIRELLWAEHVISELLWKRQHGFVAADHVDDAAHVELRRLARAPHAWARAYAAEMLRTDPTLRTAAVWAALAADADPLVAQLARPQ